MIRSGLTLVLLGTTATLCGCASGYYVNLAEVRQQQSATRDRASAQPDVRQAKRAVAPAGSDDVTGSVTRTGEIRPWPRRGTAEWNQIQRDELERERRINEALRSVCRGC